MADETAQQPRIHEYHAEAKALHGELHRPLKEIITPQALAQLHPTGGYIDQDAKRFGVERAISYDSAYTHVSGSLETKKDGGWCTLSTSVVVGLNILEVVTADRIVAQIFTEHPLVGYTPRISFLATRFENLRIAGHPVDLEWDMNLLGSRPEDDGAYTRHPALLEHLGERRERICGYASLPAAAHERYNQVPKKINEKSKSGETKEAEIIECSLVTNARGTYPGRSFGHVIHVPDFGEIYLATVLVKQTDFVDGIAHTTTVELNMVEAKLGCAATGTVHAGACVTNGGTKPPPNPGG